jgi:alpha-ketoglutarate-dependent taurine dioxygenase
MTAATDTKLQVRPLSGWTGALIDGVDISVPLSSEAKSVIQSALHQWKVVFFRDQVLDHAAQIAFGAQFGDVTPGHPYEGDSAPPDFPQIHTVSPAAYDHRYGTRYRKKQSPNGPKWHADVTPLINPPSHSILRAEAVPPYGGDTQFVNVAAVYQGLSESVRALIDELRAEHRFGADVAADRSSEKVGDLVRTSPLASIHPVVRVHPDTGERVVYVNPSFTREIVDLAPRESRHVLDLLFEEIGRPEYSVRFKWAPGSVAFWDNRAALHLAPQDFEHVDGDRILHRITLVGDVPVGVDGRPSDSIAGEFFGAA